VERQADDDVQENEYYVGEESADEGNSIPLVGPLTVLCQLKHLHGSVVYLFFNEGLKQSVHFTNSLLIAIE
jgi:hypothetical protein